ncbi:hypothetical protein TrCOL_g10999 [Triparma columacea]|uniref:WW domain-containing protein n=2 Tax=Triparma columacea TaxID=722753 RepID=A0A9W7GB17_9STRA|nr:hypothetical protein TrCOL_g10999 [Triparma columacea]
MILGFAYFVASSQALKNALFEAFLAMTFLILPAVSIKIFTTFACHNFDDATSFLKSDYSINCKDPAHNFYSLYATGMILVYPIGIPLMYFVLLWRKRDLLEAGQTVKEESMSEEKALKLALEERKMNEIEDPTLKALSFLYGSYEPKFWWFEVFETLRKLALTGFLVFLAPGTAAQVLFSLIMCFFALVAYRDRRPFVSEFTDKFNNAAQLQLFFTLLGALAMKVNLDNENLQNKGYFDMILTGVQFVPTLIATIVNLVKAKRLTTTEIDTLLRESRQARSDKSGLDFGNVDLDDGGVELSAVGSSTQGSQRSTAPPSHIHRASSFNKFKGKKKGFKSKESETLANREERSLSKEAAGLGGEVVSKHEKIQRIMEEGVREAGDEKDPEADQNWEKVYDDATGFYYYQHKISGMSTWEIPEELEGKKA